MWPRSSARGAGRCGLSAGTLATQLVSHYEGREDGEPIGSRWFLPQQMALEKDRVTLFLENNVEVLRDVVLHVSSDLP